MRSAVRPAIVRPVSYTHLKGFTVWGVQFGAYGTQQAAQQAGGPQTAVFFEQQRYRVIDSLWQQKEDAQAYRQGISQESYVTELTAPSVKLKLTGSQQKLDAIAQAVQSWEAALTSLLEAQQSLTTEEASLDKAKQYAQTASEQDVYKRQKEIYQDCWAYLCTMAFISSRRFSISMTSFI